ncbi:MAG: hypothetical protein FWH05_07230 [Oscillospiraceae bacterium]|nr:hypothetical protein [Oscillospiraceae bacterium]
MKRKARLLRASFFHFKWQIWEWLLRGEREQTLMAVTGSGKTFTMANIISKVNHPAQTSAGRCFRLECLAKMGWGVIGHFIIFLMWGLGDNANMVISGSKLTVLNYKFKHIILILQAP